MIVLGPMKILSNNDLLKKKFKSERQGLERVVNCLIIRSSTQAVSGPLH